MDGMYERKRLQLESDLRLLRRFKERVKLLSEELFEGRMPEEVAVELYGRRCPICGASGIDKALILE